MPARQSAGIEARPSVGKPETATGQRSSSAAGVSRTLRATTSGSLERCLHFQARAEDENDFERPTMEEIFVRVSSGHALIEERGMI